LISVAICSNALALSWPTDHPSSHLQVQTNALGKRWLTVLGSEFVTSTNMTINPRNGAVFYRLVYP
jgi:hypothetical protein